MQVSHLKFGISLQNLSREPQVLKVGLTKLDEVLEKLSPLHKPLDPPGGSVLLRELASVASPTDATLSPQATPLLHTLSSCHAYVMMFVHVCRMGQVSTIHCVGKFCYKYGLPCEIVNS